MDINKADSKVIEQAITQLDELLDSDSFMEMVNGLDTSPATRKRLYSLWAKRSKLSVGLLRLYASEISANDAKFKAILGQLRSVNKGAAEAADRLKKIADRIESAVEVAKAVDKILSALIALGLIAI